MMFNTTYTILAVLFVLAGIGIAVYALIVFLSPPATTSPTTAPPTVNSTGVSDLKVSWESS